MRLREAEESVSGTVRDVAGNDVVGLSQKDLLTWLFDYQTSKSAPLPMFAAVFMVSFAPHQLSCCRKVSKACISDMGLGGRSV